MATSADDPVFIAATSLEAKALRRKLGADRVFECGMAFSRTPVTEFSETVISCGVAGGLRRDLSTGTIVVPRTVRTPSGQTLTCDEELTLRLYEAAARLGLPCTSEPLVTSAAIVTGAERDLWAQRGFSAVDMETGLLHARRIAAVRVILDTPQRELSPDWINPLRAMLRPSNWPQLVMLAREAPRCAELAARVASAAFG